MDLDAILRKARDQEFMVDLGEGLEVMLRPAVGRDLVAISTGAMAVRLQTLTEAPEIVPDPQVIISVLKRLLVSWDGMTPARASQYLGVDVPGDKLIQPTEINRHALITESAEFRGQLVNALVDHAKADRDKRQERLGN